MNEFEIRYRVQTTVNSWVNGFMLENQLPASMMVDALNAVLVDLKDQATREFINSVTAVPEQETAQEELEKEE